MNTFKSFGIHLDVSRDAIMTIPAIRKYIAKASEMGFDTFYLYMEDMYELEGYPFFGHMRGRYTKEELKKIDNICKEYNMTAIPCIQTLGHLPQYLRLPEAAPVRDTQRELLCGSPDTYKLIEAMVKTMRECFTCKKLHVGMDEAFGMGTGNYLRINGYRDKSELFIEHLKRVCEICKKYDFIPMIWDDVAAVLIKSGSKFDAEKVLPKELEFVPWAYGCCAPEPVKQKLESVKHFDKPITFAATTWTHQTMLPMYNHAKSTILTTAKAAKDNGVDSFMITSWGDDGAHTDYWFAMPNILSLSYYNQTGKFPTDEEMSKLCREYDVIDYAFCNIAAKFDQPKGIDTFVGKRLVFGDILFNSCRIFDKDYADILAKAAEEVQPFIDRNDNWKNHYEYAQLLMRVASRKAYVVTRLRDAYLDGDKKFLEEVCENIIPELKELYVKLELIHRNLWLNTYKPYGYQKLEGKYGAVIMRLGYAHDRIREYLDNKIDALPEFDEAPIRCKDDEDMVYSKDGLVHVESSEKYISAHLLIDLGL